MKGGSIWSATGGCSRRARPAADTRHRRYITTARCSRRPAISRSDPATTSPTARPRRTCARSTRAWRRTRGTSSSRSTRRSRVSTTGRTDCCSAAAAPSARSGSRPFRTRRSASTTSARSSARMSEPAGSEAPQVDVRIGSTANALQPVSSAERSLAAGSAQWVVLLLVAGAAAFADQLTKQVVGRTLELGESVDIVGPFTIHHVQNSGIAFGLFGSRTSIVIGVTAIAVGAMLVFFARSGRRHPVLPVALGLVLGGSIANLIDRVRLGTSPTSSTSSPGRPSTLRTRSSSSASRSSSARSSSPTGPPHARSARWRHFASASLRRRRDRASTARSPNGRRSARDRSPSGFCSTER